MVEYCFGSGEASRLHQTSRYFRIKRKGLCNNKWSHCKRGESALINTPVGAVNITCTRMENQPVKAIDFLNGVGEFVQIMVEGEPQSRTLKLNSIDLAGPFEDALNLRASLESLMTADQIAE